MSQSQNYIVLYVERVALIKTT